MCRYPTILQCFQLNHGTGGLGAFRGGSGVVREILFRRDLVLSILCERRVFSPYGMQGEWMWMSIALLLFWNILLNSSLLEKNASGTNFELTFKDPKRYVVQVCHRPKNEKFFQGGDPGKKGKNLLIRHDGPIISLGGKNSIDVHAGVSSLYIVDLYFIIVRINLKNLICIAYRLYKLYCLNRTYFKLRHRVVVDMVLSLKMTLAVLLHRNVADKRVVHEAVHRLLWGAVWSTTNNSRKLTEF